MTYTDTAHRGHTISSYEDYNLRAFVAKVAATHPRAGRDELYKLVAEAMVDEAESDRAALRAVVSHWAPNAVNAYLDVEKRAKMTPTESLVQAARQELVSAPNASIAAPMRSAARSPSHPQPTPQQRQERQRETRVKADAIKAQIVMLALTMPNGKALRDCTGEEMAVFDHAYHHIAEQLGPTETVGEHFTEEQVRELMRPL